MSIIYQIKHKTESSYPCYVGSTCDLVSRMHSHKSCCHNKDSKKYHFYVYEFIRDFGGWNAWEFVTLASVNVSSKRQLHELESIFIKHFNAKLNVKIPTRTPKQHRIDEKEKCKNQRTLSRLKQRENGNLARVKYYQNNREEIIEKNRIYYQENKTKIEARRREKIFCLCGCQVSRRERKKHLKTIRHREQMKALFSEIKNHTFI